MYDETTDVCDECGREKPIDGFVGFVCGDCEAEYQRALSGDLTMLERDPDSAFYNPYA